MRNLLLVLALGLGLSFGLQAQQDYKTAIGLRLGPDYGLTVKHFLNPKGALEGILHTRSYNYGNGRNWGSGFNLIGLYEWHGDIKGANGLNWYVGIGGHIGSWRGGSGHPWFTDNRNYTTIGVSGILGLEYTIPSAPLNLSLDWKPAFNIYGPGWWADGIAFSLRYAIK